VVPPLPLTERTPPPSGVFFYAAAAHVNEELTPPSSARPIPIEVPNFLAKCCPDCPVHPEHLLHQVVVMKAPSFPLRIFNRGPSFLLVNH